MATEAAKLRVGAFVISAAAIGIAALIWLGASRFFADEEPAVTYFAESVQGLDPGAAVKLRGVPAGRVESIGIAPDNELIEVVMNLKPGMAQRILNDPHVRAQLQLSGITGLRYVEIDRHSGDALQKSPQLRFDPLYPLVPSTPSQFKAIQEALEDIYGKVMGVDLEGISNDMRATLQSADELLRSERTQRILTNLSEMTDAARKATANVAEMTEGVELAPVVRELRQTNAETKQLIVELREGRIGTELRGVLGEADALARTTQTFIVDLQTTVERINRTAENLEQLTDLLRQQPSRLLFSEPPPPRPRPDGADR